MHTRRLYLLLLLLVVPAGAALAGDAMSGLPPAANDLLSLTPYGVLGFGAWLLRGIAEVLSKGISVTVTFKVSKEDRDLLKKITHAAHLETGDSQSEKD